MSSWKLQLMDYSGESNLPRKSLVLVLIMLLSVWLPVPAVSGAIQIEDRDFGVLEELYSALDTRSELLIDDGEGDLAANSMASVDSSVRNSTSSDALGAADDPIPDATWKNITIEPVQHPSPYEIILDPSSAPPGATDSILNTLINITDYVIWTQYETTDGQVVDKFEVIDFSASLLSLFPPLPGQPTPDPFLHEIDIDNLLNDGSTSTNQNSGDLTEDGDCGYDISVGLTIAIDPGDGWGVEGTNIWVEPTVEFSVKMFNGGVSTFDSDCDETPASEPGDSVWDSMKTLRVSLFKQFTYSESLFFGSPGPSYIWVIDTHHTIPPEDTSLEVGIERIWFDAPGTVLSALNGPFGLLGLLGVDTSGIKIVSIAAPYAIHLETLGSTNCPIGYDPVFDVDTNPILHGCGTQAGFGYVHLNEPVNGQRDAIEVAYIEFSAHPAAGDDRIPSEVDLVIRSDSVLSTTAADIGEGSLTSIEYFADRRADIHVHFHEDRRNVAPSTIDGSFGNVTESAGWLRGMPAGSLDQLEIERVFKMLGSDKSPELPGRLPERLGLIIAIKNFSKDNSPNSNDPSLPVNPADPPQSLVVIRSVQSVTEIDYGSWFLREGAEEDRRQIRTRLTGIPTTLVLFGSFAIDGGDDGTNATFDDPNGASLDIFSRILDTTILNLVDIFINIGAALNAVPQALGEALSGGLEAGSGLEGTEFHLQMFDDLGVNRIPDRLDLVEMDLGTSNHPTLSGDHILLSEDRDLNLVQGRTNSREPLMPIALSIRISGFSAADIADDQSLDEQMLTLSTVNSQPLRVGFIQHDADNLSGASLHIVQMSALPDLMSMSLQPSKTFWNASEPIDQITYIGISEDQRQVVRMKDVPTSFEMEVSDSFSWIATEPMGSVEIQVSNHSNPKTMDEDHFLFNYDGPTDTAYLSARITNISEIAFIAADIEANPEALDSIQLKVDGNRTFRSSIQHIPGPDDPATRGLHLRALINPLPGTISMDVPNAEDLGGPSIVIPEFNTSQGLRGIADFMDSFSEMGRSVNQVLADLSETVTGKAGEESTSEFQFGFEFDADRHFDLTVDAVQGSMSIDEPEWRHGISMNSGLEGEEQGFHVRAWLPGLAPDVKLDLHFQNESGLEIWDIEVEMSDWKPLREEFIIQIAGFDAQDLDFSLIGFQPGESTEVAIQTSFSTRDLGATSEVTTSTSYQLSHRLDYVIASILNRDLGTRSQLFVSDIPAIIDLYASIGESISVSLDVPESERIQGDSVGSVMLQQLQWFEGQWWPATIFLKDVPGEIDLTTEPANVFDITQPTAFQGVPEFDFSASGPGMDLYMEISGRAINTKGDTVLLAENLMEEMTVSLDANFHLAIRSSGEGIGKLYLRQSDVPAQPGIRLVQMEALGENLKSATISLTEIGLYPVFRIGDVQGGRIVLSARASVDFMGMTFDGRAVLLDAQQTSGIPTGTTIGVNGLASDLSLLNVIPGFDGSTTHYMVPEPLTTGVLTLCTTLFGGGS